MLCVNITITDDDICEDDESFLIQLTPADDCANIVSGSGSATIIDNDGKFDHLNYVASIFI